MGSFLGSATGNLSYNGNVLAQMFYESLGWRRDEAFFTYHLPL